MDHPTSPPITDLGSISYSWPANKPFARADDTDMHPARQCSFDLSPPPFECSEQAAAMADADQMFRDGLLLPLRVVQRQGGGEDDDEDVATKHEGIPVLLRSRSLDSSQRMTTTTNASKRHRLARPASLNSSPSSLGGAAAPAWPSSAVFRANIKLRLPSFGRCGRVLPRRLTCRYLRFLAPLYQKMVGCVGRRTTTRHASCRAADESRNGKVCEAGAEDAIRDAILHCKNSL
ncbi:hypothetical protein E2562_028298 [Oryza meyeriana var. granulata]|uniref:Membrane-associated kinase regulator 6 n=1 Tax=Oryza meyeriana var. granulata TaxID=110450 RepID=A0A6G1E2R8_9ORYZ|nr:hypothetical protein E2562_028298 [Oryza meyeriana var. granulata]